MNNKRIIYAVEIALIFILSLYIFLNPSVLATSGGVFLEDGVVIAKAMFLIFMLSIIAHISRLLLFNSPNSEK